MFRIHRNSQKRIYCQSGIYFITTITYNRFPYFEEEIFQSVFKEVIDFNSRLKDFWLFIYIIDKDHLHLLLQTKGKNNISEIMRSIKTNSSREINKLLRSDKGDMAPCRLYRQKLYPYFKWQKSFHFHLITSKQDFLNHFNYINKHQGYKLVN